MKKFVSDRNSQDRRGGNPCRSWLFVDGKYIKACILVSMIGIAFFNQLCAQQKKKWEEDHADNAEGGKPEVHCSQRGDGR